jgi:hypothetical protein
VRQNDLGGPEKRLVKSEARHKIETNFKFKSNFNLKPESRLPVNRTRKSSALMRNFHEMLLSMI